VSRLGRKAQSRTRYRLEARGKPARAGAVAETEVKTMAKISREMLTAIQLFALKRVGLAQEDYERALNHPAFNHVGCSICARFEAYLVIKQAIEDWERIARQT
jgi:hypothetical protein